jgi:hypothetical protein
MRSLAVLCHDSSIPIGQRDIFCSRVVWYLSEEKKLGEVALSCLRSVWIQYDTGGISVGRSLRSTILETILARLEDKKDDVQMRILFSILLGMYYDHEFINAAKWHDYPIEHFSEDGLTHRIWLSTAAFCLEVDEVADMKEWSLQKI